MSSIRKVAEEAGVSIATVSRVINGAQSVAPNLRTRVLTAVEACDYSPSVGRRTLESIGLIYAGLFSIGSPYDSACLDGMVEVMRDSPYDLTILDICRDRADKETLRQFFTRKGIRGAVVRSTAAEREMVSEWVKEELPLIVLGDHFECPNLSSIYAASAIASREAMEHLVSLGHKRIGFAACQRDDGDHLDRLNAYQEVMEEHGLTDPSLVYRVPAHRFDGMQLMRNLLGTIDRPTAMYIADPLVASGAINEAHRLGVRIPEELSIIGFDDTDTRNSVHPRMTAVCQDSWQLGRDALQAVIDSLEGRSTIKQYAAYQAWLDIGDSTAPPPAVAERVLPSGSRLPPSKA